MKCSWDWQCLTGYCFDDNIQGKDTCSTSNSCSSTVFSHYGRCLSVPCEMGTNCASLTCNPSTGLCDVNLCKESSRYLVDRCEGIPCSSDSQCLSKMCFQGFCTGKIGCSSRALMESMRCEGSFCNNNEQCKSKACVGNTCSDRKECASDATAAKEKCEGVECATYGEC